MSAAIAKHPVRCPTPIQVVPQRRRLTMRTPTLDDVTDPLHAFFSLPTDVFRTLLDLLCHGNTKMVTLPGLVVLSNLASTCWFFRMLVAEHRTAADVDDFRRVYATPTSHSFSLKACAKADGSPAGVRVNLVYEHDVHGRVVPIRPAHVVLLRTRNARYARRVHLVLLFSGATSEERAAAPLGVALNVRDAVRLLSGVSEMAIVRMNARTQLMAPRTSLVAMLRVLLGPAASAEQRAVHSPMRQVHVHLGVSSDGSSLVRKMLMVARFDRAHRVDRFVVAVPAMLAKLLGAAEPVHVASVATPHDHYIAPGEVAESLRHLDVRTLRAQVPKKKPKRKRYDNGAVNERNVLADGRRRGASYAANAAIQAIAPCENGTSSASEDDEPAVPIAARYRRLLM